MDALSLTRQSRNQTGAPVISGSTYSDSQIEFVNLIINHLTEHGVMDATLLYESRFTDLTPQGLEGIFSSSEMDALIAALDQIRAAAEAA
jgi:type I restriction enzyme, R subunit